MKQTSFNTIKKNSGTSRPNLNNSLDEYFNKNKELEEFVSKAYTKTSENYTQLAKKIQESETQIDNFKVKVENKIEEQKIKLIEVIGVFISVFTFISVDIQIFKENRDPLVLCGFIFIFISALITFNLLMKIILESEMNLYYKYSTNILSETFDKLLFNKKHISYPKIYKITTWTPAFAVIFIDILFLLLGIIFIIFGSYVEQNKIVGYLSKDGTLNLQKLIEKDAYLEKKIYELEEYNKKLEQEILINTKSPFYHNF